MTFAGVIETARAGSRDGVFETSPFCGFGEVSIARLPQLSPEKQRKRELGTQLAISNSTLGVAGVSGRTGRGGARNHADRESVALTAAHVGNLRRAERHAYKIGLPLTRMITIHWEAAGVPLMRMAKATGRFTDLLAKALSRHASQTAWIWTHENGDNKGGHCHLLAHVPADLVPLVTRLQLGWLRGITGRPYRKRVIFSRPIGGLLGLERGNPELHAINLEVALAYILKGASPEAASKFSLELLEPGGRVIGKRCGSSQNIAANARKSGRLGDD